jgi:hypothetical protein
VRRSAPVTEKRRHDVAYRVKERVAASDRNGWDARGFIPGKQAIRQRRPGQPIGSQRRATLPQTGGPHTTDFLDSKIKPKNDFWHEKNN